METFVREVIPELGRLDLRADDLGTDYVFGWGIQEKRTGKGRGSGRETIDYGSGVVISVRTSVGRVVSTPDSVRTGSTPEGVISLYFCFTAFLVTSQDGIRDPTLQVRVDRNLYFPSWYRESSRSGRSGTEGTVLIHDEYCKTDPCH